MIFDLYLLYLSYIYASCLIFMISVLYFYICTIQSHYIYNLEPYNKGTMLFFPSSLSHTVYPFYTSDKERISISGNIHYDVEKPHV